MEYTSRWNNFQFRSPTYLDGHFEPYRFDLVKWESFDLMKDNFDGEPEYVHSTESCYTVGTLIWNPKEEWFEFESCGLRFLKEYVDGLNEWILAFAKMKEIELKCSEAN